MSNLRALAAAAVLSLVAPLCAQAAPDALFGNTLQITTPKGAVLKVLVNADGTYQRIAPDGSTVIGTWAETGDQMCFTPVKPEPKPATCIPKITQAVGATWTAQIGGGTATLTIVSGR
jgi:hypothetical protein